MSGWLPMLSPRTRKHSLLQDLEMRQNSSGLGKPPSSRNAAKFFNSFAKGQKQTTLMHTILLAESAQILTTSSCPVVPVGPISAHRLDLIFLFLSVKVTQANALLSIGPLLLRHGPFTRTRRHHRVAQLLGSWRYPWLSSSRGGRQMRKASDHHRHCKLVWLPRCQTDS